MPPKSHNTRAKKTNKPIPNSGTTSVDPNAAIKQAIETKIFKAEEKTITQVDDQVPDKINYSVSSKNGQEYSVYLMWSDLKNNHNKYYIV